MNESKDKYNAMAVSGGRILAIGTNEQILSLRNENSKVYNLEERVVIPGLIDTHTHIFWVALGELYGEVFIPLSVKDLLEYTKKQVKSLNPGEWIYFRNTYPTRLKEYRFPTIEELDSVAPNNPVYVDGAYAGQANSYLLNMLGIDEKTPDPPSGKFIKNKTTGRLTGLLFRCGDIIKKYYKENNASTDEIKKGFQNIQSEYNKLGITSVIDGNAGKKDVRAINELYDEGKLSLRVVLTGLMSPNDPSGSILKNLESSLTTAREWAKLSFAKIIVDGGILTGTSYMRKPYNDRIGLFGIELDDFKGILQYDTKELASFINTAFNLRLQMTAHCIGDAAVDILLDAYELYHSKESIKDRRYSIIHADFTDKDTLSRIKNLGLSVLFQPAWHYMDGDILKKVLDGETMRSFLPYKEYLDMGIHAASGSDHMIKYDSLLSQNPYNPYLALYNMVTRKTILGTAVGEKQAISRYDALAMYTKYASYVSFDENIKGTLEVGKLADFAVLSHDYFSCPEEDIKAIHSVMTVVDGEVV